MFVDYSGLQRFSYINKCFAQRLLQLLEFESFNTLEEKIKYFREFSKEETCLQGLEGRDFESRPDVINYLFRISLSNKQMQEVSEVVKRCPTIYAVEIFETHETLADSSEVVAWAGVLLKNTYDAVRTELCEAIKHVIAELKPEAETSPFQDWHLLQKYLFYSYRVDVPKFMAPKKDIVIIPMNFPKAYIGKVNRDGFMKMDSSIKFFLFGLKDRHVCLSRIEKESLVLMPIKNKISTIWKDGDEKDYIGTIWNSWGAKMCKRPQQTGNFSQPNLVALFQDDDDNEAIDLIARSQSISSGRHHKRILKSDCDRVEWEANFASDKENSRSAGSVYDIFSPLSSNELPTALTPPNIATSASVSSHKKYACSNIDQATSNDFTILPPPPSFLPCYSDFESSSLNGEKHGLRYKLKQVFFYSLSRQKRHLAQTSFTGFDATGSWGEYQSSTWNEMSTKKFVKFKLKKLKRNYRCCKEVAKQCIEDFHDNSNC